MRWIYACIIIIAFSLPIVAQGDGTLRRIRVPILMYHYVGELPEDPDGIRTDLTLEPDVFRGHLQYLQDEGYMTISLYELNNALLNGTPLPPRPIVLTFDDGHLDHYVNVLPLLEEYNAIGTFFIVTDFADRQESGYMSWEQIQILHDAGMNIESHTKSHPSLANKDFDFLVYQILGSVESVHHFTDNEATMFSYPAGAYDDYTLEIMQSSPVQMAVTTQYGMYHTTDGRLELPRLRIHRETGVLGLDQLLNSDR